MIQPEDSNTPVNTPANTPGREPDNHLSRELDSAPAARFGSGPGNKPLLITCLALFIGAALLLVGFGLGFGASTLLAAPAAVESRNSAAGEQLYPKFDVFWEAMNVFYRDFYGQLPTSDDAAYGAIKGVLSQLEDPNTSFMTPAEADYFRSSLEGSFEGIGARVDWDLEYDTLRVVEPFENQPAWKAGVKRDDLITKIDGENIIGTDLNSAVSKIRGPKGSMVVLTILRTGESGALTIDVVRDTIELPTIDTNTFGDIAYVRLNTFNENAGDLVRQAVSDALAQNPKGLIFDLRGNPGGLLSQAVKVASIFMQDSDVLIERFADGKQEVYKTEGTATAKDIPLVVLVNEGSASASEIVAGAIQDNGRGQMVGVTTYGKGSVQLPQTLSDGSILRVTIARWFTPGDRTIDGTGLEPDVQVEISDEQLQTGEDPQLDKAIELLGGDPKAAPVEKNTTP